jgi:hypothetical protein
MGIIIPILIGLFIAHRIVSDIEKKNQNSNHKEKHQNDQLQNQHNKKWMPPGVIRFLQKTDLYKEVISNVSEIRFKNKVRHMGKSYLGYAYYGDRRIIEIQWQEDKTSAIHHELAELDMSRIVCHELGHIIGYSRNRDRSERSAIALEMEFLNRIKTKLYDRPYRIIVPGKNGFSYSVEYLNNYQLKSNNIRA